MDDLGISPGFVSRFLAAGLSVLVSGVMGKWRACELVLSGCPSKGESSLWGVRTNPVQLLQGLVAVFLLLSSPSEKPGWPGFNTIADEVGLKNVFLR